jgi:hypothetical protein
MQFVLVIGRPPCPQSFCTFCCEPIQEGYLREIATRLYYCGHECYVDHRSSAALDYLTGGGIRSLAAPLPGNPGFASG